MAYTPSTTLEFSKKGYTPSTTLEFSKDNVISATIEQRIYEVGTLSATIEQDIYEVGTLSATIEQIIVEGGVISATIEQRIYEVDTLSATIEQNIVAGIGTLSATIEQNIYEVGVISAVIQQQIVDDSSIISVTIQQEIFAETDILSATIEQVIYETGVLSAVIEQTITNTVDVISATIEQKVYEVGTISVDIEQVIYDLINGLPRKPRNWQAFITLGTLDVSANLTGSIVIDAEESAAKVASFTLKPSLGIVDLTEWVNQPVTISFGYDDSPEVYTLYKGWVDIPNYDPNDRLTSFVCTDLLQKSFENDTQDNIKGKIGGTWSEFVFEETNDNWKYANDVISTVPKAMDYSVDLQLEVTDWASKDTPDFIYQSDCILDESLEVELASSRNIVNSVDLVFNYQYSGYREAVITYVWNNLPAIGSLEWTQNTAAIAENSQVIAAIEDAGWFAKEGMAFAGLPVSQIFYPGGNPVVWLNSRPNGITHARVSAAKRFIQNVTDQVTLSIKSPASIANLGEIKDKASYGVSAEYAENSESNFLATEEATFSYSNPRVAGQTQVFGEVDYTKYVDFLDQSSSQGYTTYDNESLVVAGNRVEMNSALEVAREIHATDLLSKHRQNRVSFTCLLNPLLSRTQTIEVDTDPVKSRGKVSHYRQEMNIDQGYAISLVTTSVSKASGLGIVDTPSVPQADIDPPILPEDPLAGGTNIFLGNCVANISNNPGLTCEIGVDKFGKGSEGNGETVFVVQTPEVVDNTTQDTVNEIDQEFIVSIPQELLILEA